MKLSVLLLALALMDPIDPGSNPSRGENDQAPDLPHMAVWRPGPVLCSDGRYFSSDSFPPSIPASVGEAEDPSPDATFAFTLTNEGRALSIAMIEDGKRRSHTLDIAPTIAAGSFGPSPSDTQCEVNFSQAVFPVGRAEPQDLVLLGAYDPQAPGASLAWTIRTRGDCLFAPIPRPVNDVQPDFAALSQTPGAANWTVVTFDLDEEGIPVDIAILASSGAEDLDRAVLETTAQSRLSESDRTGCIRTVGTAADVIGAPVQPELGFFGPIPEACDADNLLSEELLLEYPAAYQRRAIEGWAILRYDIASTGKIENIEVLEAQPAVEFGMAAKSLLEGGRAQERASGLAGCVIPVSFSID
ncbi:MAG: TonB family protein [Erythrobacter sp.]